MIKKKDDCISVYTYYGDIITVGYILKAQRYCKPMLYMQILMVQV